MESMVASWDQPLLGLGIFLVFFFPGFLCLFLLLTHVLISYTYNVMIHILKVSPPPSQQ